jgi:hypothetical protein
MTQILFEEIVVKLYLNISVTISNTSVPEIAFVTSFLAMLAKSH